MFHRVEENASSRDYHQLKHHEEVLPRIVGSETALLAARTYVYRLPIVEKIEFTWILNEWNQSKLDDMKVCNEVIRPKAANVIKCWMEKAKKDEAAMVRKFLSHLKNEENYLTSSNKNGDEHYKPNISEKQSLRGILKSAPGRTVRFGADETNSTIRTEALRPQSSLTFGSYYPSRGCGNNTSVFHTVDSSRPTTYTNSKHLLRHDVEPDETLSSDQDDDSSSMRTSSSLTDNANMEENISDKSVTNDSPGIFEGRSSELPSNNLTPFHYGSNHLLPREKRRNPGRVYERTQFLLG